MAASWSSALTPGTSSARDNYTYARAARQPPTGLTLIGRRLRPPDGGRGQAQVTDHKGRPGGGVEDLRSLRRRTARRWHGFQENVVLHQLKRDVHQTVIVGEAHGISARNACCSAEAGE